MNSKEDNDKNMISVVIMAHPKRAHLIPALKAQLGDVPVVFDEIGNIWDTCRRSWLAHDFKKKYGIVIQDDAVICKDFYKRAAAVLRAQEKAYITAFYCGGMGKMSVRNALKNKKDHFIAGTIFNEVALCLPTDRIKDMVQTCDDWEATNDHFIQRWGLLRRIKVWYPVPSLIDHLPDEPSLYREMHGRDQADYPRIATAFIDRDEK